MTTKDELHRLVDILDDEDTPEALEYLRWLAEAGSEALTPEELARVADGEAQIERGESITLDELRRRLGA